MKELFKNIRRNWKTSLLGGGSLGAAVIYGTTQPNPDVKTLVGMVVVGLLGLISADGKEPK